MLRRNVITCSPTTGHFFDIIIIVSTEMKCPALIRQITSSENMLGMSGMVVGISYFSHGKKVWIPVCNRGTFSARTLTQTLPQLYLIFAIAQVRKS